MIETIPEAPKGPFVNFDADLPRLDGSGKLHMVRLGENTSRGPAHRARINEEIQLLRQVQKKLTGS
jgi:hypothetical protein